MEYTERAFCRLVDLLLTDEQVQCHDFVAEVFVRLRTLMKFSSAIFMPIDPASGELRHGVCFDCGDAEMTEYLDHYAAFDPFVRNGPSPATANRALRFSDVAAGVPGWEADFADFMARVPYRHALASLIASHDGLFGVLSVHRIQSAPDFDDEELERFGRIASYLAKGVDLRGSALHLTTQALTGLVVVADDGTLLWMNQLAEHLIDAGRLQPRDLRRLPGSGVRLSTPIGALLARSRPLTHRSLYALWACMGDGPALRIAHGERATRAGSAIAAHLIEISPLLAGLDGSLCMAQLGLTPAELRIARRILSGRSFKQIARESSVEECTVKKHAVHIYEKAGVNSRSELSALLNEQSLRSRPEEVP